MNIGLFQLENLLITRTQFVFLDLRDSRKGLFSFGSPKPLPEELKKTLDQAIKISSDKVEEYLNEKKIAPAYPIVLLCEKSKISQKVANRLEKAGYQNVYVVTGGEKGLLSEF